MAFTNVIISYEGEMDNEVLKAMIKALEAKVQHFGEKPVRAKKLNSVLIEVLQNLIRHVDQTSAVFRQAPSRVEVARVDDLYAIHTRNYVSALGREKLTEILDQINQMDEETLRQTYKAVLENGRFNPEGGAGLGYLDIARKAADGRVTYSFEDLQPGYYFFDFRVNV